MSTRATCLLLIAGALMAVAATVVHAADSAPEAVARELLDATGTTGGLVVHLGCGDGRLTAALRAGEGILVHGLDGDAAAVAAARAYIQSLGAYGLVSVDVLEGNRLPYAERMVNLLVVDAGLDDVPIEECLRVLVPGGVVAARSGDTWKKTAKPWPDGLDEWTHQLHGPGGNPVSADQVAGPPARLKWTAGPLWARSHGWTPSVSAMVTSGGRLFAIVDETLTCADATVPSKWFLVARDAFNGVLLWKRPIPRWDSVDFSGTPDTGGGGVVGRFTMPPNVGKRLVAVGDTVFVTLGPTAPVTALDAATGDVRRVYDETAGTDEILLDDGRLILAANAAEGTFEVPPVKHVWAVDVESGRVLWREGPFSGIRTAQSQDPHGRLELAADDGKVFALSTESIECLAADSGETLWRIERPALPEDAVRRIGFAGMYEYLLAVMLYHDGVVLLLQPEPNTHHTYHTMPGTLYAFDAADGRPLWKHAYGGWGHCTPPDVFVVGDVVWTHVDAETEFGSVWGSGFKALDSSQVDYRIQGLALRTGELVKELPTRDIFNVGHHHRCHRNRITERYLLSCRRGVEFVDLSTGENFQNHWVRSGCLLGYLPANGVLYVTPHPCGCYINAKLIGFNALAPREENTGDHANLPSPASGRGAGGEGSSKNQTPSTPRHPHPAAAPKGGIATRPPSTPLHPHPAAAPPPSPASGRGYDWPTYRHDGGRSGATEATVGSDLELAWRVDIGSRPSSPVVAGGRVLVAEVDAHTVHALDARDGTELWRYTAGARIDSPPTVHNGLALFGSADGRVHCVRAADGDPVWRFDARPERRLVTAFGQLESPWPVPGSVLVEDGKCWFAAGRCSYLDGGIRLYALDPATGEVLHRETIYSPDPATGRMSPVTEAQTMPGVLNDIPATDGSGVFIRQMQVAAGDGPSGLHLFTTGGYLDPSWFNRTFWQVGRAKTSGLMVLGHDVAFGTEVYASRSRETVFRPGANVYRLMCISFEPPAPVPAGKPAKKNRQQGPRPLWESRLAVRPTAMVRAADTVFVAGPPDVVDPADPHAAWEGRKGGVLATFATADGEKLVEHKLPSPPVWDGMAATDAGLTISTESGEVLCFRPARSP